MSDGGKELHGKQRNVSSLLPEEIVSAISALRDGGRREPRKLLSLDAKLVHYSGDEKLNTGAIVQASVYRHDEHNNAVSVGAMTREIVEEVCPAEWLLKIIGRALESTDVVGKTVKLVYGDEYSTIIGVEQDPSSESIDKVLSVGLAMTYDGAQPRENYGLNPQNGLFDQIVFSMDTNGKNQPPQLWIQTKAPSWTSMHREGHVPDPSRKRMLKVWRATEGDDFKLGEMRIVDGVTAEAPSKEPRTVTVVPPPVTENEPAEKTKKKRKRTKKKSDGEKLAEEANDAAKKQSDVSVEEPPPAKKSKKVSSEDAKSAKEGTPKDTSKSAKEGTPAEEGTAKDTSKLASTKKGKKKKDPNAPKKSASAYILYSNSIREEIKKANPTAKFTDMGKLIGDKWQKLSAESRKEWNDKAKTEREKYKLAKNKYDTEAKEKEQTERETAEVPAEITDDDKDGEPVAVVAVEKVTTKSTPGKKKADPNAPKRPKPSYIYYQNERRPLLTKENPDKAFGEIAKMIGAEWQKLSANEKKKWSDQAAQDKQRYTEEMGTYMPVPQDAEGAKVEVSSEDKPAEKKKTKKKKDPNAPKRPLSAYILFNNWKRPDVLKKYPNIAFLEVGKKIGEEWRNLSDAERQVWKDKTEAAMDLYKKDLEAYEGRAKEAEEEVSTPTPKSSKDKKSKKVKDNVKDSEEVPAPPKSPSSKKRTEEAPPSTSKSASKKKKTNKDATVEEKGTESDLPTPSKSSSKKKSKKKSTTTASEDTKKNASAPSTASTSARRSKRVRI